MHTCTQWRTLSKSRVFEQHIALSQALLLAFKYSLVDKPLGVELFKQISGWGRSAVGRRGTRIPRPAPPARLRPHGSDQGCQGRGAPQKDLGRRLTAISDNVYCTVSNSRLQSVG